LIIECLYINIVLIEEGRGVTMGSFEDRLQRLRSVDITEDSKTELRESASPSVRRAIQRNQKPELSDKAANLIATALKDFLR